MKSTLTIVGVVLFFLVIFVTIFYKVLNPPLATPASQSPSAFLPSASSNQPSIAVPTSASPDTVATACYVWYVKAYAADTRRNSPSTFKQGTDRCFTSDFVNQWSTIAANTDSDPVLLAQDYANSWTTSPSASILNQTATQSTVLVSLGTGSELTQLLVTLNSTPSGWRVSGVSAPTH